jgi:hypothetical protein
VHAATYSRILCAAQCHKHRAPSGHCSTMLQSRSRPHRKQHHTASNMTPAVTSTGWMCTLCWQPRVELKGQTTQTTSRCLQALSHKACQVSACHLTTQGTGCMLPRRQPGTATALCTLSENINTRRLTGVLYREPSTNCSPSPAPPHITPVGITNNRHEPQQARATTPQTMQQT